MDGSFASDRGGETVILVEMERTGDWVWGRTGDEDRREETGI